MTGHLGAADIGAHAPRPGSRRCRARKDCLFWMWRLARVRRCWRSCALDLRSLAGAAESLPPLLQGCWRGQEAEHSGPRRRCSKQRLAGVSAAERERVRARAGAQHGRDGVERRRIESVEAERPLHELGSGLTDGGRAAQPAWRARLAAAGDIAVRPSDAARAGGLLRKRSSWASCPSSRRARHCAARAGRADRDRGDELPLSGRRETPEELWDLLAEGRDAIGEFPRTGAGRSRTCTTRTPTRRGKSYVREGGFLYDAAEFDRGVLRHQPARGARRWIRSSGCCWRRRGRRSSAPGIEPPSLRGSRTGVFVGVMYHDYGTRLARARGARGLSAPAASASVASGRIAYTLGLQGPGDHGRHGVLVVAGGGAPGVPGAAPGECDLALAGGVTVMATPACFIEFSRQRGLSPDGRCKAFSARPTARAGARACGWWCWSALRAQRNGHRCWRWCVAPRSIRTARARADGAERSVAAAGDPAGAAQRGLSPRRSMPWRRTAPAPRWATRSRRRRCWRPTARSARRAPLWLGSIKSNFGHTQAAAGVAGIIKMVLAMEHGAFAQELHAEEPSPHVDWSRAQCGC